MKVAFSKIKVHVISLLAYILCMLVRPDTIERETSYTLAFRTGKCTKTVVVSSIPHAQGGDTPNLIEEVLEDEQEHENKTQEG